MPFEGIGAAVRRKEDVRFLSGRGSYTDDINRPGQLYAYVRRSDRPHAKIDRIDTAAAAKALGVVAVYTGADMAADNIGGLPCGWQIHNKDGSPMKEPPHPVIAVGKVRHVGDPVAVVIAETKQAAKDAAEQIVIDYQDLPAAASLRDAIAPGASLVHDDAPGNLCYDWHIGDKAVVDAAFPKAAKVVKLDLTNNRLIPNAMEPRAAVGEFDGHSGDYTLYTTSQNPHVIRLLMGAFVLHIPESKLRVVAPDVGGGFGSKIYHYAEEAIVTWAAGKVRRPVKWTAERSESFMSDAHGRDHDTTAEMALDADGNFLALRVSTLANMGAYLSTFAPCIPTYLYATLLAGVYKMPVIYCEVKAVFTNTVPVDAYRGAGRPEATYLLERLVDACAYDTKTDRVAIRRKNFIPADAFPYQTPVALQYDSRIRGASLRRGRARKTARHRHFHLHRGLRHRAVGRGGIARRARRPLRGSQHQGASHRQRHRLHRYAQPRPGTRDHVGSTRVRTVGRADGPGRCRARRHCQDTVRHGHLWQPQFGGRRQRYGKGDGQGHRQG
jgi:carbon-monoxide dehydrogenase large subunit